MSDDAFEDESTPAGPSEPQGRGRTSIPPDAARAFKRFEKIVPDAIRKGLEKGIEAGLTSWEKGVESAIDRTGAVREALGDTKLPRELASAMFQQIDETKNGVMRVVAKEVRDFLEATDIATELKNALTSLSFEIRTEVRFIPNDAGTGVRPQVKAASRVNQKKSEDAAEPSASKRKRSWRPRDTDPPLAPEDADADL